ncbi:MAG: ABC transporter ATP-binding protein [Candidatus Dormibacteria bacterium]
MSQLASFREFAYHYPPGTAPALGPLSLALEGGATVVCGPSGGGKTTLLRCFNGLVPHFHGGRAEGSATVLGEDLRLASPRHLARRVAMVFQEPEAQFVLDLVESEVAFGPQNLGLPPDEVRRRTGESLERMGVGALASRRLSQISGGQRQRVALAAALAMGPQALVLDEPTSQLDDEGAAAVAAACQELVAAGVPVVAAEQRPERLGLTAARELWLGEGRLQEAPTSKPAREASPPTQPGELLWALESVAAGHQERLLEVVELGCRRGEVICLTGPNGSGKTTLLRTAAGLLPPLAGSVKRRPGRIAYLPQEPGAILHQQNLLQEVRQTIRWLRLAEEPRPILEQFGLWELAARDPRDLSTGQRQRAALAALLVGNPEQVFLDEPTRGTDALSRRRLLTVLRRLCQAGSGVLVATSDRDFAQELGHRVLELSRGELVALEGVAA